MSLHTQLKWRLDVAFNNLLTFATRYLMCVYIVVCARARIRRGRTSLIENHVALSCGGLLSVMLCVVTATLSYYSKELTFIYILPSLCLRRI